MNVLYYWTQYQVSSPTFPFTNLAPVKVDIPTQNKRGLDYIYHSTIQQSGIPSITNSSRTATL